jgi:PAS domain S-box-containing protein
VASLLVLQVIGGDQMGRRGCSLPVPGPFDETLPPRPSSVGVARALVRDLLTLAGRDDLLDDTVLLVSEIVTNALIHAGSPIGVRGEVGPHGVRVEVSDASPHHPTPRDYASTAGTGRGLALVVDLVDDWGVTVADVGKTVWFELGRKGASSPTDDTSGPKEGRGDDASFAAPNTPSMVKPGRRDESVHVELLMMPLLLHEAWREHAETLLREYLLASLDLTPGLTEGGGPISPEGGVQDPIRVHADATDAITLLEEQVPVAHIDMEPDKLMAQASESDITVPRLWVEIPRTSVPHFDTLERALDHALVLAESGRILAPRTQPEVRAFRRWVCRQVRGQTAGRAAIAWSIERETVRPTAAPMANDELTDIANSTESLLAADDKNQIVAVSESAGRLLGYDSTEQLVGQRLVAIIPPRFHQAHIAGFTLHLLVGRSPLLGREVEVPALRRDGTEVSVRLEVMSRSARDGTALFVSRIRPVGP